MTSEAVGWLGKKLASVFRKTFDREKASQRLHALSTAKTVLAPWAEKELMRFYHPVRMDVSALRDADLEGVLDYRLKSKPARTPDIRTIRSLDDDLRDDTDLVIVGRAGQGKSIFLRHAAYQMYVDPKADRIPILVSLRHLHHKPGVLALIRGELRALGLNGDQTAVEFLKNHRAVLLLDGYDELPHDERLSFHSDIDYLRQEAHNTQIIVSSRPENYAESLRGFAAVKLCPLTPEDVPSVVDRLCIDGDRAYIPRILSGISEHPEVLDILDTPIMVALLIVKSRSLTEFPKTIVDFYGRLLEYMVLEHDGAKPHDRPRISKVDFHETSKVVCCASLSLRKSSNRSAFLRDEIEGAFAEAVRKVEVEDSGPAILADICSHSNLITREDGMYEFVHRSLLEFFAAKRVARRKNPADRANFYRAAARDPDRWRPELKFLSVMDSALYHEILVLPPVGALLAAVPPDAPLDVLGRVLRPHLKKVRKIHVFANQAKTDGERVFEFEALLFGFEPLHARTEQLEHEHGGQQGSMYGLDYLLLDSRVRNRGVGLLRTYLSELANLYSRLKKEHEAATTTSSEFMV